MTTTPRTDAVYTLPHDRAGAQFELARSLERELADLRAEFNPWQYRYLAAVHMGASYEKQAERLRNALQWVVTCADPNGDGYDVDKSRKDVEHAIDTARAALVQP